MWTVFGDRSGNCGAVTRHFAERIGERAERLQRAQVRGSPFGLLESFETGYVSCSRIVLRPLRDCESHRGRRYGRGVQSARQASRPHGCNQGFERSVFGTLRARVEGAPIAAVETMRKLLDTPQSGQFSFGLVLYELAAGRRAFVRESAAETMTAIMREEADPLPATVPAPLIRYSRVAV